VSEKMKSDLSLWNMVTAIVAGDAAGVSRLLAATPLLAGARFQKGATRQSEKPYFLDQIGRYVYAGDTVLHIAAAAYQNKIVRTLIAAGADVHAKNRMGDQALHAAAVGLPGSPRLKPTAQAATIVCLIEARGRSQCHEQKWSSAITPGRANAVRDSRTDSSRLRRRSRA
jgi:hypothetical protein